MVEKVTDVRMEDGVGMAYTNVLLSANKYMYYALQAEKDGNEQAAQAFREISEKEAEQARLLYDMVYNVGTAEENLKEAIGTEKFKASMYDDLVKEAKKGKFKDLAKLFKDAGETERANAERFEGLLENTKL